MTVLIFFMQIFWPKKVVSSNIFFSKTKNNAIAKFWSLILNMPKKLPAKFKKIQNETHLYFCPWTLRKKNRWTGHHKKNCQNFFCPYFFRLLRKKTFPKCPRTCILVKNVKSYESLEIFSIFFLVQNTFFKEFRIKSIFFKLSMQNV
jgi:hypothetical protein